jgi:hypothetical protein
VLELNLVDQQNVLAQARGDMALGLVQVYRALGGGWQIRINVCETTEPFPAERLPENAPRADDATRRRDGLGVPVVVLPPSR